MLNSPNANMSFMILSDKHSICNTRRVVDERRPSKNCVIYLISALKVEMKIPEDTKADTIDPALSAHVIDHTGGRQLWCIKDRYH